MSHEIFRQLLDKYISGDLSAPEKERLNEMINDDAYQDTLESVVREVMVSDDYDEIDDPALKARIDAWLDLHLGEEKQLDGHDGGAKLVTLPRRRWSRVAAASIILLLAAGGLFFFLSRSQKQLAATQQSRFRNDVAPGGDGAVLTLSGGQTIALDSMTRGRISTQGNTTVVNANGQLSYNVSDEKPTEILYNTLTTRRGNQYQLVLPDGSRVWLNAASSITYPTVFINGERKVNVTGEAYFEIARNDKLPFIVQNGELSVHVLGTHFDLNTYDDDHLQTTTLLEGSIKVIKGNSVSLLKPGQQAMLAGGNDHIRIIDHADLEEVVAWKNGVFRFTDATIESVMRQVERWYDVEVEYQTKVSQHFVADIPRDVPLSELLKLLEMTDQVHFKIEGRKITVIP